MPKKEQKIIYIFLMIFLTIFFVIPLIVLFINSIKTDSGFGVENISEVFYQADFLKSIGNSAFISSLSGIITTVLAFILAYTINYTNIAKWLKTLIVVLISIPMLFPTITYGFAIIYSYGKQGLISSIIGSSPFSIYGFNGLLLGYVIYTIPSAFLLLNNSFKYVDKKYLSVSELMKDGGLKQFIVAILRPMISTIGVSFIQTFFLCFTDYGIPAAIGGEYNVISTTLYNQMLGAIPNINRGAVIAIVMLIPSIITIFLQIKLDKTNFRYTKISKIEFSKNKCRDILLAILSFIIILAMLSIFVIIFIIPFVSQWPYNKTISFSNFFSRLEDISIVQTLINSLLVAFFTGLVGSIIIYLSVLITERSNATSKIKKSINVLAMITNTIPGMVLGVAFLISYKGTGLHNTLIIIIISNIIHFFSTPYFMAKNAFSKLNISWEMTGMLMGDSWIKTIFKLIIPNSLSTLTEIFGYYFINSMVSISAVVFLTGAKTMVLTTKIKELQHYGKFEEIFVLSLVIFLINLIIKCLIRLMFKIKEVN